MFDEASGLPSQQRLTRQDVVRLLAEPSADMRAETAVKVGSIFAAGGLSKAERRMAEDIFRAMVQDAEVRVRRALSQTLKESPQVPADVAGALARDVDEVAVPVLEYCASLSDTDLLEIVSGAGEAGQAAVARRSSLSGTVADALAESGSEHVAAALVANDGARLREETLSRLLDKYGDSERVKEPMVHRSSLPLNVAERLVSLVSEGLRHHLVTHHELPPAVASDLLVESRERATVSLLDPTPKAPDVLALVDQLHANGRLTPTLIIRALCMGDLTFFEAALAKRAGIPVANAYTLVHDRGELGLARLFEAADMPPALIHVARMGATIAEEMSATGGDDRDTFRKVMIERVVTRLDRDLDTDNLDYLIAKLGRAAA